MSQPYRTLFAGTLVQESFLSLGGTDDFQTTVDSPFCRDGQGRPTLRGTGLAGALIATLRRHLRSRPRPLPVPASICGNETGRCPSVWRFFNSHPANSKAIACRQHVAIEARTGAAAEGALFNLETLPPDTRWPLLLEVDSSRDPHAVVLAREALAHWMAGRCLLGREVARGLGWLRLVDLQEFTLTSEHLDAWPNAQASDNYTDYVARTFSAVAHPVTAAGQTLAGWLEISGTLSAGARSDGYGFDSLSIGGHASEELSAAWDKRFCQSDGIAAQKAKEHFDPDFAFVTWQHNGKSLPYIPGSSLRGPLRHALARLLRSRGQDTSLADTLFGTVEASAKLLICDALPDQNDTIWLAWLQHHAEDEFAGGAYGSAKFDRTAVLQATFNWRMVLEDATAAERQALDDLFQLAKASQIGIGGGQWRGHGWLHWSGAELDKLGG